ncbi:MAG: YheT family hydrolase [Deferrisomatales bacterium]
MPLVPSTYRPPPLLAGGHLQTVVPALCRRVPGVSYRRERVDTPDGDFLDLDWSRVGGHRLAVITHGLEGSTGAAYVRGAVRALNRRGWDALAWNLRGCSGELNRRPYAYHSGDTADLGLVVDLALARGQWETLGLLGFSVGGNMTLKYLGERGDAAPPALRAAVAVSVPCDLAASARQLARPENALYLARFLRTLKAKARAKSRRHPGAVDVSGLWRVRDFAGFDDRVTAPLHGFASAEDYWARASCRPFVPAIRVPALLVNARNDPFLAPPCFPAEEARASSWFHLEVPAAGGHVGFPSRGDEYWSEVRAADFLEAAGTA